MNFGKQLKEGLLTQNPVLVQLLGMCSTLACVAHAHEFIQYGLVGNHLGADVGRLAVLDDGHAGDLAVHVHTSRPESPRA